jgi:hypothetical protein
MAPKSGTDRNNAPGRGSPAAKRQCRSCAREFVGESWQRLCWACWRSEREERDSEAVWQKGYDHGLLIGRREGYRDGIEDRPTGIESNLLERAIRLCHPDRHCPERAAEANAVTAALLNMRIRASVGRAA